MSQEITSINLGGVNCYLIKTSQGYVMIDSGFSNKRTLLEKKLGQLGCKPGDLKLIILTHGDSDHAGNSAYLREKLGAKIAIHPDDAGMVEQGNMGWNRKAKPDKTSFIFGIIIRVLPKLLKTPKFEVFKPDSSIDESFDLAAYGLEARVVHLPGHSQGSIGVLTANGDLFCGDFLYNTPGFNLIFDLKQHQSSVEKVKKLPVKVIYPGHGKPFSMERFLKKHK